MRYFTLLAVLFTILAGWLCFAPNGDLTPGKPSYFFEKGYSPDAYEYFLPAANLALHNSFPFYGFMSPLADYKLCPEPDSIKYLHDTQAAGAMVFPSKPPLYALLLGLVFKIAGFSTNVAFNFNLWCLLLTAALMPLAGFLANKLRGLAAGAIAALVFLTFHEPRLGNWDAEALTAFLVMLSFTAGIWAFHGKGCCRFLFFGFSMALLLLCKGYFVLTALLVGFYLLYLITSQKTVRSLVAFILYSNGLCIPILAWMLYINPLIQQHTDARLAFAEKLSATAPKLTLNSHAECFDSQGQARPEVIEFINKTLQCEYARANERVVISNQYGKYNILDVHNEYCTDGDFHPEWRVIKTSFYNNCSAQDKHGRMGQFYSRYPKQVLQIALAKLKNVWSVHAFFLYLAVVLILASALWGKGDTIALLAFVFLISVLLVLTLVYGDIRYVQSVESIALFTIGMSLISGWGNFSRPLIPA